MRRRVRNNYALPFGMSLAFLVGVVIGAFIGKIFLGIFLGLLLSAVTGLAIRRTGHYKSRTHRKYHHRRLSWTCHERKKR